MSHRMRPYIVCVLTLAMFVMSCSLDEPSRVAPLNIMSPTPGWTYYDDSPVYFQTNIISDDIVWTIDPQEWTFQGNGTARSLKAGEYTVTARYGSQTSTVSLSVQHTVQQPFEERRHLLVAQNQTLTFPGGIQYPAVLTLDGTMSNLRVSFDEAVVPRQATDKGQDPSDSAVRDIRIPLSVQSPLPPEHSRSVARKDTTGTRTFHVIDTVSQMGKAHEVEARVIHESERYRLWKPFDTQIGQQVLDEFIAKLDSLVIPRVTAIWGNWTDIDQDGKIAVLFCPTINEEKLAVGFFNPNDFFAKDTDVSSPHYNPYSNEMDILYVAIPEADNGSYSTTSIMATIGHELTHAITFSQKTWLRVHEGQAAIQAELFLDEGWSHLSENLCGLGVSGGNIRFLERYLTSPASYSFASTTDTVGSRGATMLFLTWLFWRQGGMTWDETGNIADNGGIAFLRRMVQSDGTGWEAIGQAYGDGKDTDSLLRELFTAINRQRATKESFRYTTDPVTQEPVEVFSGMGDVGGVMIGQPATRNYDETVHPMQKYSFCFFPACGSEFQRYTVNTTKLTGEAFISAVRGID